MLLLRALGYAMRGWHVFPVHWIENNRCSCGASDCSTGKHPLTVHGLKEATTDREVLENWFRRWPEANIALATGATSGIYVVDLDGEHGILEWHSLCDRHGEPIQTLAAVTGGGGRHLYFRQPVGSWGNTAKKLGQHIDTRGTGGYVLLPNSSHASGRSYEWEWPERPILELPVWAMKLIRSDRDTVSRRPRFQPQLTKDSERIAVEYLAQECDRIIGSPKGTRNDTLIRASVRMFTLAFGGQLRLADAWDDLKAAALSAGLPLREVERTLESALEFSRVNPRRVGHG